MHAVGVHELHRNLHSDGEWLVAAYHAPFSRAVDEPDISAALGHTGNLGVESLADAWAQSIRRGFLAAAPFQFARLTFAGVLEVDVARTGSATTSLSRTYRRRRARGRHARFDLPRRIQNSRINPFGDAAVTIAAKFSPTRSASIDAPAILRIVRSTFRAASPRSVQRLAISVSS